ncbi:hypothetical protein BDR04DRAFT_1156518 [Suillus decipiens]|nr:hypothetical protein BDR04DRAFT_1156518 [Suillus decipiens]
MRLLLFCIFLYLVGAIQAANITNTTTDDSFKAPSFTTRTIWTIISSSVLTIFACVYSAIHPNIPSPKDRLRHILRRRLGIMITTFMAPEMIVIWAMRQCLSARQVTRQFKDVGYPSIRPGQQSEERKLTLYEQTCHLLALLATGVLSVLVSPWRFPCALVRWIKAFFSKESEYSLEDYTWTQTHSFFVLMGGFMLYVDGEPYLTLRPDYILKLIGEGCIDVPILTARQIQDKSKGNMISKGLVMLQMAWFLMQLITRVIYHLEITQLEVGTLAFAFLNFLIYALWWHKPLNVQCPHPVYWKSTESMPESHIHDIDEREKLDHFGIFGPIFHPVLELIGSSAIPTSLKLRVPTFDGSIHLKPLHRAVLTHSGFVMAIIFGGIHCMAWCFAFPSYQEQLLWRISAIAITCAPLVVFYAWMAVRQAKRLTFPKHILYSIYIIYMTLYITVRVVLLVLMFTTLRSLSPDAYKAVSWTSLVPHL